MVKHSKKRNMQRGRGKSKKNNTVGSVEKLNINVSNATNKYIPKFEIKGNKGDDVVILYLKDGQTIINNHGCMSWMDNDINVQTTSRGGILKGMFRSVFTSVSMFMSRYTGVRNNNTICNSSFLPGEIVPVLLKPGQQIIISPDSLICFTDNLLIDSKSQIKGLMVTEGLRKTRFTNNSEYDGMVWLNSYGGSLKKTLNEGESLMVDNGLFLASYSNVDFSLKKVGGIKSSILSGEGFTMKFTGPCDLLLQNKNHYALVKHINNFVKRRE
jgi:uncharacterized protein (TIGR00266 family)